eukprot:7786301-Pyramimonas_sp.AAC.1
MASLGPFEAALADSQYLVELFGVDELEKCWRGVELVPRPGRTMCKVWVGWANIVRDLVIRSKN